MIAPKLGTNEWLKQPLEGTFGAGVISALLVPGFLKPGLTGSSPPLLRACSFAASALAVAQSVLYFRFSSAHIVYQPDSNWYLSLSFGFIRKTIAVSDIESVEVVPATTQYLSYADRLMFGATVGTTPPKRAVNLVHCFPERLILVTLKDPYYFSKRSLFRRFTNKLEHKTELVVFSVAAPMAFAASLCAVMDPHPNSTPPPTPTTSTDSAPPALSPSPPSAFPPPART
eukprot:gnl/Spiro4/4516_TR2244_c0_g1_i1.p1 gnl/Spiro4/4516_TR2244_c0_g1~~gnl/Spiro4/4516_TR2244_c0_g1_i1.p1  ORF type:complete len:229 (+),score=58.97 gnl/Spiro4/4516_TR2244_c0_g1_i1:62-748(+)